MVMGGSELEGRISVKSEAKTAASKKTLEVHLDEEDEDWLAKHRKKEKEKNKGKGKESPPKGKTSSLTKLIIKKYLDRAR